jgi:hypothetical protein
VQACVAEIHHGRSRYILKPVLLLNSVDNDYNIKTVNEIPPLIHNLTRSPPSKQLATLNKYFTPTASFTHPFCHTGSWDLGNGWNSRWAIARVYRWYKIMCPRIAMRVDGVAVEYKGSGDKSSTGNSLALAEEKRIRVAYATVRQSFGIWIIPFYRADVRLVVRLSLDYDEDAKRYFITGQEDCYPLDETMRFLWFGLWRLVVLWQIIAVFMCILLSWIGAPVSWWEESEQVGDGGELSKEGWNPKKGRGLKGLGDLGYRNGSDDEKERRKVDGTVMMLSDMST